MFAKLSDDRAAVAEALRGAGRIVVTTHVRPDGDALGSMLAAHVSAARAGKDSCMVRLGDVPQRYGFLFERHSPAPPEDFSNLAAAADLILVLDACSFEQLAPAAETLRRHHRKVAVIDHHATADDVGFAVWRDESSAAVGVMVFELLEGLGWPLDRSAAEALMTAICADTGWFRYANTDARALKVASALVGAGVRPDVLYARLYQSDRPQRLRLLAAALGSLELHADGRAAVMTLTRDDFARTGAAADETDEFVNEPLRIARVEVAALITAQPDGSTRVSLRSRRTVDVSRIAARFGGGGHVRASGFQSRADVATVKGDLIDACTSAIEDARPAC